MIKTKKSSTLPPLFRVCKMKTYVSCCALILLFCCSIASASATQQMNGANADSAEVVSSAEEKAVRKGNDMRVISGPLATATSGTAAALIINDN